VMNHLPVQWVREAQEGGRRRRADLCQPKLSGKVITRAEALRVRVWTRKSGPKVPLGYGVIGNTTVSGTVILGSSPGIPALKFPQ
jgi:hypothetical protein